MLGLALSGGGFRASLFHIGSLIRINEAGLLPKIDEVTSVSGGSITSAYLAINWSKLQFDHQGTATNFDDVVVQPLRKFCGRTIDVGTILGGILSPFHHPSNILIRKYRKHLFGDKTLQDMPAPGAGPRFTIYATSLQTGASVRFTREYLGEYHLGKIFDPNIYIAFAVAASSAFPPPLCPVELKLDAHAWKASEISDQHGDEYLKGTMWLADGGIYDNLGLERLTQRCDRVLVSDAGAPFSVMRKFRLGRFSQLARTKRALDIMGDQVRALRARHLVREFIDGRREGAYWGIGTAIDDFPLADKGLPPALVRDSDLTRKIAKMRTRLNKFNDEEQAHLINWGYALCDGALRSRLNVAIAHELCLPCEDFPI